MPSWRDVQAYSIWPPYQVIEPYYPFHNSTIEDFTIGGESCDSRHTGYCNGPLKSGSIYRVKVRAFTAPDKFTDTSYSFPIQTGKCFYFFANLCGLFKKAKNCGFCNNFNPILCELGLLTAGKIKKNLFELVFYLV